MTASLSIAVAQINCTVGDLEGNCARIAAAAHRAQALGAQLLVTPELSLCGYPAEDLLLRPDFYRACDLALNTLAGAVRGVDVLVGHPLQIEDASSASGYRRFNAASLLRDGKVVATYLKRRLPNYEVFDEERYFESGTQACVVDVAGVRVGINICADVWESGAAEAAQAAGAQLLVALNASPYHVNKQATRYSVLRDRIEDTALPVIYCNLVGGQDELVFDGASCALDKRGRLALQMPVFEEALELVQFANDDIVPASLVPPRGAEAEIYAALVMGVRDYLGKNRFPGAIIGLSGGIDSALTLAIAVDALGADHVRAVMMPSPYTAQMSLDDSCEMVRRLGVQYDEIAIEPAMQTFANLLAPVLDTIPASAADTTAENLQARIRGMMLMAISNRSGAIVLTTGNKSEMATGYATLYGDMAGGFAVIKDVYKTLVYRLSEYRNTVSEVIPLNIITRPPSAELKPDQKDQDTLPPYEVLDAILQAWMEEDLSVGEIVARGYDEATVRRVIGMLRRNEYKRRQAPPGVRITQRGFGKDWRYPITNRFAGQ